MGAFDAFNMDGGGGAQDFITRLLQAFGQGQGQGQGQNLSAGLGQFIRPNLPAGGGTANPQPSGIGGNAQGAVGVSPGGPTGPGDSVNVGRGQLAGPQYGGIAGPAPMPGAPVNGGGGTPAATGVTPQNGLAGPLQGFLNPPANPAGTALPASSGVNPNMFGGLPYFANRGM